MTQKELLYVEDAILHEVNTMNIGEFIINSLTDQDLADFMKKELKKHQAIKDKLLNELEVCCNE